MLVKNKKAPAKAEASNYSYKIVPINRPTDNSIPKMVLVCDVAFIAGII